MLRFLGILTAFFFTAYPIAHAESLPLVETSELKKFSELGMERQKLIGIALETGKEVAGMPYKYGGNGPVDQGFDCSGAMYYILRKTGLKPPRTSADQYLWVKEHSGIHLVANTARKLEDPSFQDLKPGDLVFWTGTFEPNDGRKVKITHVGMFLGHEKRDGRAIMINATNGRSYRGKIGNGYGIYDFRVPRKGSKSRIIGYGTPPGLIKK